jgi:CheY-like chemotaxis protein
MARILLVGDDADSGEAMARMLQLREYDTLCVPNGREAPIALTDDTPDFVVLYVRMPQMSGTELLKIVRSYLRLQHVPVLLVTAYPKASELRKAATLGVIGVLPKVNLDLSATVDLVKQPARLIPPHNAGTDWHTHG